MMRENLSNIDYSTLNLKAIATCRKFSDSRGQLGGMGSCCAGDPPGFPSYFLRSVYNNQGNDLRGVGQVIKIPEGLGIPAAVYEVLPEDYVFERRDDILRRYWNPLPLEHPRTQVWVRERFKHLRHCYESQDAARPFDKLLIWPGGCCGDTPFGHLRQVEFEIEYARKSRCYDKWTPEYQAAFVREIEESSACITALCTAWATPDRHLGTRSVREFYPQFVPTDALLAGDYPHEGNWWEVLPACPTPEACPGQYGSKHPVNGNWCQMCGWHEKETTNDETKTEDTGS